MICGICGDALSVVDRYRKFREHDNVHDDCLLDHLLSFEEPIVEYKFIHANIGQMEKEISSIAKQGLVIGGVNHMEGTTFLVIMERIAK